MKVDKCKGIEEWENELKAARWVKYSANIWKSPWGDLYRGPHKAWMVMLSVNRQRTKKEFLQLPMKIRRYLLSVQADGMVEYYNNLGMEDAL